MPHPEQVIARLRKEMAGAGITFFMVYCFPDVVADTFYTKVTSNSTREGITAILSTILQPTDAAVQLLVAAFARQAQALASQTDVQLDTDAARHLLEELCKRFTLHGWEKDPSMQD